MIRQIFAFVVVALVFTASPVLADQINGEWCPPGGGPSLTIRAENDVTFAGKTVAANVTRHHVDFVIADGEPNAGAAFSADQLNDDQVRVTIGAGASEIWTPCKPVS